jgi:hypothetical protein
MDSMDLHSAFIDINNQINKVPCNNNIYDIVSICRHISNNPETEIPELLEKIVNTLVNLRQSINGDSADDFVNSTLLSSLYIIFISCYNQKSKYVCECYNFGSSTSSRPYDPNVYNLVINRLISFGFTIKMLPNSFIVGWHLGG